MNSLILKDESGQISDTHVLEHIHTTLKLAIGDVVKCTVLNKGLSLGTVIHLEKNLCKLQLSEIAKAQPQWFDLVVGLSRPQTSKKILEHATTFGAKRFHFFKAALSEKSYLDSKIFENNAYEEFLLTGLSQAAIYANLPEFKLDKYNPADQYTEGANDKQQKFILDIKTDKSFLDVEIDFNRPITLAIGPERGWISEDLDRFHRAGFTSIKISSSILRVEHAVYSAVSQLELLRKRY